MTKERDNRTHRAEPTNPLRNIVGERVIKPKKSKKQRVELRKLRTAYQMENEY